MARCDRICRPPAEMGGATRICGLWIAYVALAAFAPLVALAHAQPSPAEDARDDYLIPIARTASPLIAALELFRARRSRCPGLQDRAEFEAILGKRIEPTSSGGFTLSPGETAPWIYQPRARDPMHCSLSKKLGWDPDLLYVLDADGGRWVFSPGDGGPDRPLALKP